MTAEMSAEQRIESYPAKQRRRLFPASADLGDAETVHRMRVASRRRRFARVKKFLDGGRRWVKKVKLHHE